MEVAYTAADEEHRLEANTGLNHPQAEPGLSVGQSVEVRYGPARPERAQLLTLGHSEAGFFRFMTFFGVILFGVLAVWMLASRLLRSLT